MKKINFIFFLLIFINRENWSQPLSIINDSDLKLTVDYSKTLDEMLSDANFDYVQDSIKGKYFPFPPELITKKINCPVVIIHFDQPIIGKDARDKIREAGYRPASIADIIVLEKRYPALLNRFNIVALESRCWGLYIDGYLGHSIDYAPFLRHDQAKRNLDLCRFDIPLDTTYYFLALVISDYPFPLEVDYSKTAEQMLDSIYNMDYSSSDINNNFPLPTRLIGKKILYTAMVFHFDKAVSTENIIKNMNNVGYRPAKMAELLALAEIKPELPCEFDVVALGSYEKHIGSDEMFFPALSSVDAIINCRPYFKLFGSRLPNSNWDKYFSFLGIKK